MGNREKSGVDVWGAGLQVGCRTYGPTKKGEERDVLMDGVEFGSLGTFKSGRKIEYYVATIRNFEGSGKSHSEAFLVADTVGAYLAARREALAWLKLHGPKPSPKRCPCPDCTGTAWPADYQSCKCHECAIMQRNDHYSCETCHGPEGLPHRDSCPCCAHEPQWDVVRRLIRETGALRGAMSIFPSDATEVNP